MGARAQRHAQPPPRCWCKHACPRLLPRCSDAAATLACFAAVASTSMLRMRIVSNQSTPRAVFFHPVHSAVALTSMLSMRTSSSGLSLLGCVLTCFRARASKDF